MQEQVSNQEIDKKQHIRYKYNNEFQNDYYEQLYKQSIENKEEFFDKIAKDVDWQTPYTKVRPSIFEFWQVLDDSKAPLYRWYTGGHINICYNAIDRHVEAGAGDDVAIIYDSAYLGIQETFTYNEVHNRVGRIASILQKQFGV